MASSYVHVCFFICLCVVFVVVCVGIFFLVSGYFCRLCLLRWKVWCLECESILCVAKIGRTKCSYEEA